MDDERNITNENGAYLLPIDLAVRSEGVYNEVAAHIRPIDGIEEGIYCILSLC